MSFQVDNESYQQEDDLPLIIDDTIKLNDQRYYNAASHTKSTAMRRVSIQSGSNNNNANSTAIPREVLAFNMFGAASSQQRAQRMGNLPYRMKAGGGGAGGAGGAASRGTGMFLNQRVFNSGSTFGQSESGTNNNPNTNAAAAAMNAVVIREQQLMRLSARKAMVQRVLNRRLLSKTATTTGAGVFPRGPVDLEYINERIRRRRTVGPNFSSNSVGSSAEGNRYLANMNRGAMSFRTTSTESAYSTSQFQNNDDTEQSLICSSLSSPAGSDEVSCNGPETPLLELHSSSDEGRPNPNQYPRGLNGTPGMNDRIVTSVKRKLEQLHSYTQHPKFNPAIISTTSSTMRHGDTMLKNKVDISQMPILPNLINKLIEGSELITPEQLGMVPESVFVAVGQMRPCGLTKEDRIGKYKSRELGFIGMCCKHCGGQPGFGRYFPGSFNSFLSGKNAENMVDHILKECSGCPTHIRSIIRELEYREKNNNKTRPPHGSRKKFFYHIWTCLRSYHGPECTPITGSGPMTTKQVVAITTPTTETDDSYIEDDENTPTDLHSLADSDAFYSPV